MKQDEKKPVTWEVTDPKPPVIRSGHMESRRNYSLDAAGQDARQDPDML